MEIWTGRMVLAVLSALAMAGTAAADPVRLDYGAYFLGIRIADISMTHDVTENAYRASAEYTTRGLVDWLRSEQISASSSGVRSGATLTPQSYSHRLSTPRKTRTVQVRWTEGDVAVTTDPPRYVSNAETPVTPENRAGAVDLLAGLLQLSLRIDAQGGEGCNTTIRIFNGKERYDLRGAYVDTRDVSQGGYEGPVAVCTIYYTPVAGYEPEDMPSARFTRTPVNVWFGTSEGGAAPIRISYATGFGDLVLQTRALGGGGGGRQ